MSSFKRNSILFTIGALGYGLIEILWRGYTHPSMLTAGGICFIVFAKISDTFKKLNLFIKALIGCAFITSIEFIFGVIFNIILKKHVWDYSSLPFNFLGQICPLFSAIWLILSLIFIPIANLVSKKLSKKRSYLSELSTQNLGGN